MRGHSGRRVGRSGVAEQPFEDGAGVVLARQRRRLAAPRDRIRVGATEADIARAGDIAAVERQLERSELGVLLEAPRDQLIQGDARQQVRLGPRRGDAGQEPGRRARVHAGIARHAVQAGQDVHLIGERLDPLQNARDLEVLSLGRRREVLHRHSVRDVDDAEPADRVRRRRADGGKRRRHAVEERERQRGADAPQHGPPRNRFLRDDHESDLRIWNGSLWTMPKIIADQR